MPTTVTTRRERQGAIRDIQRKAEAAKYRVTVGSPAPADVNKTSAFLAPPANERLQLSPKSWHKIDIRHNTANSGLDILVVVWKDTSSGITWDPSDGADVRSMYKRKRLVMWEWHRHTTLTGARVHCNRRDCDGQITIAFRRMNIDEEHILTVETYQTTAFVNSVANQQFKYQFKEL